LLDACETGAWRPAYRLSEPRRHVRAELAVRDALVRTRTRYIALAKALVRRDGLRVPTSSSAWVPTRIAELDLSPALTTELAPLVAVYASLNEQIAAADRRIATVAASDPIVARLATAPGVGPVTALDAIPVPTQMSRRLASASSSATNPSHARRAAGPFVAASSQPCVTPVIIAKANIALPELSVQRQTAMCAPPAP